MHLVNKTSLFMLISVLLPKASSNTPPEFVLDDNVRGGDIIVRLKVLFSKIKKSLFLPSLKGKSLENVPSKKSRSLF